MSRANGSSPEKYRHLGLYESPSAAIFDFSPAVSTARPFRLVTVWTAAALRSPRSASSRPNRGKQRGCAARLRVRISGHGLSESKWLDEPRPQSALIRAAVQAEYQSAEKQPSSEVSDEMMKLHACSALLPVRARIPPPPSIQPAPQAKALPIGEIASESGSAQERWPAQRFAQVGLCLAYEGARHEQVQPRPRVSARWPRGHQEI